MIASDCLRLFPLAVLTLALFSPAAAGDDVLPTQLRRLPHVAAVDVMLAPQRPRQTIIHLRDWHFVPKDLFALDVRDGSAERLDDATINKLYEQHLDAVERVQTQHRVILLRLIKDHRLEAVYKEGLAPEHLPFFTAQLSATRQLGRAIKELALQAADPPTAGWAKRFKRLSRQHREGRLQLGVAAQLVMDGCLRRVQPSEDRQAYENGQFITGDTVTIDKATNEAREDAIAANLLKGPKLVVIELGGAHDLADNLERQGRGTCRYIRLTTKAYQRAAR